MEKEERIEMGGKEKEKRETRERGKDTCLGEIVRSLHFHLSSSRSLGRPSHAIFTREPTGKLMEESMEVH